MQNKIKTKGKQASIQIKTAQGATKDTSRFFFKNWFYLLGILIVFIISFSYTFNKKLDLNGDNCFYYTFARSIVTGHGYSDISSIDTPKTNIYPPGYPVLMTPIMLFTDSIIPQKILNGIFLLLSSMLIFYWMTRVGKSPLLAFVVSTIVLLNVFVLRFATMMMSEMSYLLFSVIALYLLSLIKDEKPFYKDKYFYLLILVATYATLIRTQGITLAIGIIVYFLFNKKWRQSLGFLGGFILCSLPWSIRNSMAGIEGNRYIAQTLWVNPWRPEEGMVTVGGFISRGFETLSMLISKALPSSIPPYRTIDFDVPADLSNWILGIALVAVISIGFWQFKKYRWFLLGYAAAVLAILFSWNAPSGNRYITTLLPFLELGLIVGLYAIICWVLQKVNIQWKFSPLFLLVLCFFAFPRLKQERIQNQQPFPPNYKNFFYIAEQMNKPEFKNKVVCSRKPSLFYVFSKTFVSSYDWTQDSRLLIEKLIESKTDYVVLEQLGYSSTVRYLYPAIQAYPDLFDIVMHLPNPDTYLFAFNKQKAIEKLKENKNASVNAPIENN